MRSDTLGGTLSKYARAFSLQTTFTALATGHAQIEQRLARWLVMVHDRVDGDSFTITHDLLSLMLGVRRQGVTVALQILEGDHLIKSTCGTIEIKDREGLIEAGEGTYGPAEVEYRRLMGFNVVRPASDFVEAT
ncbi:hypothetical protein ASD32_24915 [Rhizobium sp. Root483D2]|nr:hypothetical protein ASD32_24915 [Rhizobium sp. Root483D2]